MRYLIYLRVSTDQQEVAHQATHCVAYVQCQHNYTDHLVYEDPDTSSRLPIKDRIGLCKMLEDVTKGDTVVVAKLDRISRDIVEMVNICRDIRNKGAEILSLAEGIVADWMLGIFGSIAQKEKEDVSHRTKKTMSSMRERKERVGHIPYGFKLLRDIKRTKDNKSEKILIIENPDEILVLKEMQKLRAKGETFRQMAQSLNSSKLFNRDSRPWNHSSVSRVYKNSIVRFQRNLEHIS